MKNTFGQGKGKPASHISQGSRKSRADQTTNYRAQKTLVLCIPKLDVKTADTKIVDATTAHSMKVDAKKADAKKADAKMANAKKDGSKRAQASIPLYSESNVPS